MTKKKSYALFQMFKQSKKQASDKIQSPPQSPVAAPPEGPEPTEITPEAAESIIPPLLLAGSQFSKLSNTKAKSREVFVRVDLNQFRIVWEKEGKTQGFMDIENIREIHKGEEVLALAKNPDFNKPEIANLAIGIVYRIDEHLKVLNLVPKEPGCLPEWLVGLNTLFLQYSQYSNNADNPDMQSAYLKRYWAMADINNDNRLEVLELTKLCAKLNVPYSKNELVERFNKFKGEDRAWLDFNEFQQVLKDLDAREDLRAIFHASAVSDINGLSFGEFRDLMVKVQRSDLDENGLKDLFAKLKPEEQDRLDFDGFKKLMTSFAYMPAMKPSAHKIHDDMTRPLSQYFVESSHNTYLIGNQLTGYSSVEAYVRVLDQGCRCVEMDCWDGPNDEPVIYHGYTFTSKIFVKDVARAIMKHAFRKSSYPLVVSLEMHCCVEQQARIAQIFTETFGSHLLKQKVDINETTLPSPEQLQYKIIIKGKTKGTLASGLNNDEDNEDALDSAMERETYQTREIGKVEAAPANKPQDEIKQPNMPQDHPAPSNIVPDAPRISIENVPVDVSKDAGEEQKISEVKGTVTDTEMCESPIGRSSTMVEPGTEKEPNKLEKASSLMKSLFGGRKAASEPKPEAKKAHKIAQQLSDIILYMAARSFRSLEDSEKNSKYNEISSISESASLDLCKKQYSQYVKHNQRQFTRIYPAGKRVQSTNYDPIPHWSVGCQLVALNYQTFDRAMQLNRALFGHNGGCGYVLKPEYLSDCSVIRSPSPHKLTIQIISAQLLPKNDDSNDIIDPYCELEIIALGEAEPLAKFKTKSVYENGFNPVWNETFEASLTYEDMIFIRLNIMDKDRTKLNNDEIGFFSALFCDLAPGNYIKMTQLGYRHLPLCNAKGVPLPTSTLFIRSQLT